MTVVVRVAAVPLGIRTQGKLAELERIFADTIELVEVATLDELQLAVARPAVRAVVIDAAPPGQLDESVTCAGDRPVLRQLRTERRNSRGEIDRVFGGYGLLVGDQVHTLGDGELGTE